MAMDVDRFIVAERVVACLERLMVQRGAPAFIRKDNGPEMIAWVLRNWCRLRGSGTVYIEPGSAWENGPAEWFFSTLEHERLVSDQ